MVFRAIPLPIRPIEQGSCGGDPIYAIMERIHAEFRIIGDVFTESKAMFWSMEFRFLGVKTRVDESGIRKCWERRVSR